MHIHSCPPTLYQSLPFKTFLNSKSSSVHSLLFLKTSIAISFSCSILLAGPWPTGLSMSLALPLGSDCWRVFFLTIQSSPFLKFTCFFLFVLFCLFWIYIIFPVTLHHSFLYLHIVFPEKVRTSSWVILAVFSSVPLSPSSSVPSSDNIFRITDAH